MTHPAHTFLTTLQAAMSARAIYGEDHSLFLRQSDAAASAARTALGEHSPLVVVFLPPRVICNDRVLPARPDELDGLAARLAAHDADALTVIAAPSATAVRELLAFLASPPDARVPELREFHVSRAHASAPAPPPDTPEPAALTRDVQTLWGEMLQPGTESATIPAEHLAQLVHHITASVAASRASILRLAAVKDMDEYTFVHTVNVAIQSAALAEAVGLSKTHVHAIIEAGLLHDIGKGAIPPEVLQKKAMLNDAERAIVQRHPVDGAAMLIERRHHNPLAAIVAMEHHMHIDGSGYPAPRRHHRPHLASQIVQVADVFDALRTHRPYRAALSHDEATSVMWQSAGSKFDRDLLATFFQSVAPRTAA
ncbi:MAG TPA: HD domain-containing phosphohydrolase [Phycisphaerales bacterium]|nr:HD domain-containing phosphohydrolase [Phycisphaerales bacterium]